MIRFSGLVAGLLLISSNLSANEFNDGCSQFKNDQTKYTICLDEALKSAYRTRATWIKKWDESLNLRANRTGDRSHLALFERSLARFDAYLESSCRWRYLDTMPHGPHAAIFYKRCELQMVQQHTDTLQLSLGQ